MICTNKSDEDEYIYAVHVCKTIYHRDETTQPLTVQILSEGTAERIKLTVSGYGTHVLDNPILVPKGGKVATYCDGFGGEVIPMLAAKDTLEIAREIVQGAA